MASNYAPGTTNDPRAPWNQGDPGERLASCQDCDHVCRVEQLEEPRHLHERVWPGEPMPAGECPKCGALAHEVEEDDA